MNYSDIKYYNGNELLSLQISEPLDLVEGLIREQSLCMLAGEEGCGKSIFAMNLGLAVANGQKKFLNHKIYKNGKVLFLNNELPIPEVASRFKKMVKSNSLNQSETLQNFIIPEYFPPLADYKDLLDVKCMKEKPVLIIIDCLYWTHNSKENDNSEMKELLRSLLYIRDKHHLAILIIHHTKKGSKSEYMHSDNLRGAGVLSSVPDSIFQIRRSSSDEEHRLFKPIKLRYATDKMKSARLLSLDPNDLWFLDEGDVDENEHMEHREQRTIAAEKIVWKEIIKSGEVLSRKVILERCTDLGYTNRTIDRELKSAVESGIIKKVSAGRYTL